MGRDTILLLVLTLITIGCWIGFEVYRAYNTPKLPEGVERHLVPLDPSLDKKTLEILTTKK